MNNSASYVNHTAYGPAVVALALLGAALGGAADAQVAGTGPGSLQINLDPTGITATLNVNGLVDPHGAFFQPLGTNGRTCATCHAASQAMSISPPDVQLRFALTAGRDPLFAAIDGANCPNARTGSARDHSLMLSNGLVRVFLPLPANAQFQVQVVHDPYGCALVPGANGGPAVISVYRRPLPTSNLRFLSTIMFDGRETVAPLNVAASFPTALNADLTHQALDAVNLHAQASQPPTAAQLTDIVNFELGLYSAQLYDLSAGLLNTGGAGGGPTALSVQNYQPGTNDSLGADPSGAAFDPASITLFSAWASLTPGRGNLIQAFQDGQREKIAAGAVVFNSAPVQISNVRGLNDNATLGKPSTLTGTCTTCHDTPNVGNHSFPLPLDIGTGHSSLPGAEPDPNIAAGQAELATPDLPVYRITGCLPPFASGEPASFDTTDPGKALISGQCSDFNRGKGPILRGLAARAPYFHNGAAANLRQLVNFYDQRFQMNLTATQKEDLQAFLNSL